MKKSKTSQRAYVYRLGVIVVVLQLWALNTQSVSCASIVWRGHNSTDWNIGENWEGTQHHTSPCLVTVV
jgi:hypothetical protein